MTEAITLTESKKLVALEKTIEAGQKTFVEVGLALAEIRDGNLYRSDYSSFDEYCKEKWGWEKRYWQYVIAASETVQSLPEASRTIVHSESQARELSKASPAKRAEVLEAVAAKGPVTAKAIREEIQEAVEVKPPTVDEQWKDALGKTEIATPEPIEDVAERTLEIYMRDQDELCSQVIEAFNAAKIGQFKLHLAVWIKKLTQAQKEQPK